MFFGIRNMDCEEVAETFYVPTPTPIAAEPEVQPTADMNEVEDNCLVLAKAMLELTRQGLSPEQTILAVAKQLDVTVDKFADMMAICSTHFGDAPVE